jgi:2-polyprenyl-3-methyl-5-hydroxy-6-metoxy-1,4-benzoquinol methylase
MIDVGCGIGATSAWLKSHYPGTTTIGLEGNPAYLDQLKQHVDYAYIVDLNGPWPDLCAAEPVLCLDVLEHLLDPRGALERLRSAMRPDGTLIVSLPNVAHLSVAPPLLLAGRFDYQDAGILDRTHLHFFTRKTVVQLVTDAGFEVTRMVRSGLDGARSKWLNRASFGLLQDRLAKQYVLSAKPGRDWPAAKRNQFA